MQSARRGAASRALYDIKPVNLLAGALNALAARLIWMQPGHDVVIGCVSAYGGRAVASARPRRRRLGLEAAGFQLNPSAAPA
jgi:hypothetical protein